MNAKILINSLYSFFRLGFWLSLIFSVIMILGFSSKTILKQLDVFEKTKFSYEIPVNVSVVNPTKANVVINNNEYIEPSKYGFSTNTNFKVKSNKRWISILLFIDNTYELFFIVLIFFLLKNIFKNLKEEFDFSQVISKDVKLLGILLIGSMVFKIITSTVMYYSFDMITFSSAINGIKNLDSSLIYIKPKINFKIWFLLIGISLLILNKLLVKGIEIKKENELTI